MLVALQSVVDTGGKVESLHFAKRLNDWMIFGFPELGDVGMCVLFQSSEALSWDHTFLHFPHHKIK